MTFQARHKTNLFDFIQTSQAAKYSKFPNDNSNFYDEIYKTITSNISNCKYIDRISDSQLSSFKNSLNIMHFNIHSLQKNFDSFYIFLQFLKFLPEFLCPTEYRIKDKPLINISIPGYSFVHANSTTAAGGVGV